MILLLLLAAKAATPAVLPPPVDKFLLVDAARAIDAGRLNEARLMVARAETAGFTGPPLEKLVADLSFASGKYEEALGEYKAIGASAARDPAICERAMISALTVGRVEDAKPFAACATESNSATWRAWNARGVLADFSQDWDLAGKCFSRAHQLAPASAEVINNQGWSLALRGEWASAVPYFKQAATLDPKSRRIADNLELAEAALASALPSRRPGESGEAWAARLNDAGVIAELQGDSKRAVAAFTQALYTDDRWYARAANNLATAAKP